MAIVRGQALHRPGQAGGSRYLLRQVTPFSSELRFHARTELLLDHTLRTKCRILIGLKRVPQKERGLLNTGT